MPMRNSLVLLVASLLLVQQSPAAPPLKEPDVKLAKLSFKLNDVEFTVDAPEGSTIQTQIGGVVVTHGNDFGFSIEPGRKRFVREKRLWKENGTNHVAKEFILSTKNDFVVETAAAGEERYEAAAAAEMPYIDLTVRSAREGEANAEAMTLTNCLVLIKCAATIKLQSPPPKEPAEILEWLKADAHKDDEGKVAAIGFPAAATDAALGLLEKFPGLKSLTINAANISDEALAQLEGMQSLEEFGLVSDSISEDALTHIGNIPNLVTLSLGAASGPGEIAEEGIAHLQAMKNLQTLDLTNTRAGDVALGHLTEMRSLKVLRLGSTLASDKREGPGRVKMCNLTDDGLASLSKLANLQTLSLHRTDITGAGLKHVAGLKKLQHLELNDTFIDDAGLEQIHSMESLQLLQIARTQITSEGLAHLAELESLKELDLTDTAVDDKGLAHLSGLVSIEALLLRRTHVTDEGLIHLEHCRNLETLNLSETKVTDAGLVHLYRLKKLQSLYSSDTAVTQDGLDKLEKAREGNP